MALLHKKVSEIPQDAVRLNEDEAVKYFLKLVQNWENKSEVWPIVYTPGVLGATTVFSSFYINNYFRRVLKLGKYGRLSSYLPSVALPAIMATMFHSTFVLPDAVLHKQACPVCLQTRAAVFQSCFAVGYPMLLVPLSSFMFATRHFTYRLPSITEKPAEVLKLFRKLSGPITLPLTLMLAFNLTLSIFLTGKEFEAVHKVNLHLLAVERKLESEGLLPAD
ncbi:AGAP000896-PA-like protein [Anopheles sinensis]|uniref:AGAP000896-PA-like protein n=1 Tax=Anopheles sinensis TaxID=74873 RepID=A0A084VLH4_ANOSI|nr:AGAP000896-PA-like protein [Anopheles sinensis]